MKPERIQTRLQTVPQWVPERKPQIIVRTLTFESFAAGAELVRRIGEIGATHEHYPEGVMKGRQVVLRLTSPTAGGLTELDFDIAEMIDSLM